MISSVSAADANENGILSVSNDTDKSNVLDSVSVYKETNPLNDSSVESENYETNNIILNDTESQQINADNSSEVNAIGSKENPINTTLTESISTVVNGGNLYAYLKDANGTPLKGINVGLKIDGIKYATVATDGEGKAVFKISISVGKHNVSLYRNDFHIGDTYYSASDKSFTLSVLSNKPSLTVVNTKVVKGGNLYAYLKDANGAALSGINVGLRLNGKTYTSATDSEGKATFKINVSAGKYNVRLYRNAFNVYSAVDKNFTLSVLSNKPSLTVVNTTVINGGNLYAYLKDASGAALSGINVGLRLNGKTYTSATDSEGKATFKINVSAGKYNVRLYRNAFSIYSAVDKNFTLSVLSNKPSLTVVNTTVDKGGNLYAYLKDSNGAALSGIKVNLKLNGKTYTSATDSDGKATFKIDESVGKYSVRLYSDAFGIYSAVDKNFTLNVFDKNAISISDIKNAATNLENFVLTNKRLPNTVKVGSNTFSIYDFSYIMAEAISAINKNNEVTSISVLSNLSSVNSSSAVINATIYKAQYLDLANRLSEAVKNNKSLPASAYVKNQNGVTVGEAGFNVYTFAFAKILDFHKTNKRLPNSCTFDSGVFSNSPSPSPGGNVNSSQFKKGLNEVQNLSDSELAKYLVNSGHDAANTAIKNLAKSLINGKTSVFDQALAIFNYVRDNISYSYYSNTKYEATGTLTARKGNCCDQANLIVALCRVANIPARFSHAQGCTFSSGLVTGHVWAQIYVDGVWYSADATSRYNELGNIHNWNINSFNSLKQYDHLPF